MTVIDFTLPELSPFNLEAKISKIPVVNHKVLSIMYPGLEVIEGGYIRFRHVAIFGGPESGKSNALRYLAKKAVEKYGADKVNAVSSYKFGYLLDKLDEKPVQLILVDDAVRGHHSRRGFESTQDIEDFYELRHIFEKKGKQGVLITVFASQRYKSLDIIFRGAQVKIYKTISGSKVDNEQIIDDVGVKGFEVLRRITREIYEKCNDKYKSLSIAKIKWEDHCGLFKTRLVVEAPIRFIKPPVEVRTPRTNRTVEITPKRLGKQLKLTLIEEIKDEAFLDLILEKLPKYCGEKAKWLKEWFMGEPGYMIAQRIGMDASDMNKELKRLRESALGYAAEDAYEEYLKAKGEKYIRGGLNKPESDFILPEKKEVISFKCYVNRYWNLKEAAGKIGENEVAYAAKHNYTLKFILYNPLRRKFRIYHVAPPSSPQQPA